MWGSTLVVVGGYGDKGDRDQGAYRGDVWTASLGQAPRGGVSPWREKGTKTTGKKMQRSPVLELRATKRATTAKQGGSNNDTGVHHVCTHSRDRCRA